MKNRLFFRLLILAVVTVFSVTSCKDYDDDVSGLQKQIDELKSSIKTVQDKVDGGAVITDVKAVNGGVELTLSDGKKYTIAKGEKGETGPAGPQGEKGKDGSVVTIGDNGNWFIDGKDTGKTSVGSQGPKGEAGPQGPQGPAGEYYVPNADGYWHKVVNGTDTKTNQTWLPKGTITAVFKDGVVTLHNVEGVENGIVVLGTSSITSLVLLPDFVSDAGGALPVMNFSPLVTPCGELAPSSLVRYVVNPSNATVDQIDTENLSFRYNNPTIMTRSAKINPEAEFVSLENGILTVKATINTAELEKPTSEKIDQIMLEVPMKNGAKVSSDWARVMSSPISQIALVRQPKPAATLWSAMELKKTVAEAKALLKTDLTVVDLAYNDTIDMLKVVNTMLKEGPWKEFNIDTYNLEYKFDANDENGKKIVYELGANKTDQQKFLQLEGSMVSTRVYDLEGPNPASVDRTPIVHVRLVSKTGEVKCDVLQGFIKLNIVRPTVAPIPPVTIPVEGEVTAGCNDFVLKVGTQEMNEKFYAKAKLSKQEFHKSYDWSELTGGVGTIVEKRDPLDEHSYNLIWTVTQDELWANIGKTITKSGEYRYVDNVIKVTFTANVVQPTIDLSALLLDNYWDAAKTFITHNVAVPAVNATNPTLCTFENNINDAFKNKNALLDMAHANAKYAGYTYEYVFDKVQPVTNVGKDDEAGMTIKVTVSADLKKLQAQKFNGTKPVGPVEVVAEIKPQAPGVGDILAYNEASDLGKYLLNKGPEFMQARLRLVVKNECDREVGVKAISGKDSFLVHFLRPVNIAAEAGDNFVDAVDFGALGSYIDIMKVAQLSDWRNYKKTTTDYNFEPNHKNYYEYYGVETITVDKDKIVPEGLLVNGKPLTELPGSIQIEQTAKGEVYEGVTYPYGRLTYRNNGTNLVDPFTLVVPVTVTYKWGNVVTDAVRVKVYPTKAAAEDAKKASK